MTYDDLNNSIKKIINKLLEKYTTSEISKFLFCSRTSTINTIRRNGEPQIKSLINFASSCNYDILFVLVDKDDDEIEDLRIAERVYIHNRVKLEGDEKRGIPSIIDKFEKSQKRGPSSLYKKSEILNRSNKNKIEKILFEDTSSEFSKTDLNI